MGPFSYPQKRVVEHTLGPHYAALRALPNRAALVQSPLYAEIVGQLEPLLSGVDIGHHEKAAPRSRRGLRLVAWNIQRGAQLDRLRRALLDEPSLQCDVLLLSEVDVGMGRSGNRHVARELAEALGMSYAFGVSYLVLGDDVGENLAGVANTHALAGCAVLSRLPITTVENVDLPELRDKFRGREKRLGKKRALAVTVATNEGPLPIGACHLDSNASPRQRAQQLAALLARLPAGPALVGGDLNSSTYDASSTGALARDLLHKLLVTGFAATVAGYMTPEQSYEQALFALLRDHHFAVDGWNDRAHGTLSYDLNDRYTILKTRQHVGRFLTWLLRQLLRPWNGVVPARLDWFAGRQLSCARSWVVQLPQSADPRSGDAPLSDHAAIGVELA